MKAPYEHDEQKALVKYLRKRGVFVFSCPNGGLRDDITAMRLKEEGLMAGIPDLCILLGLGQSIWVELKRRSGGSLSADQKTAHEKMMRLGHRVFVAKGAKDAIKQLKEIGLEV